VNYMNLLSDVTVLILSHNRHNCLLPALEYWNNSGVNVVVLDESEKPLEEAGNFPSVRYFHTRQKFSERCKMAAQILDSPYAIVVSDDELYTPSGLLRMKRELEKDPDLVSVGGMAIAIWKYGPRVAGSWPYKGTFGYENKEFLPIDRIRFHTGDGKKPHSAFFTSNLNRTHYLKRCLNLYSRSPVIATEAISILTICAAGKSKYLNELFWVRNWNEFPKSHANWNRGIYLHDWWIANVNSDEGHRFRRDLIEAFSEFADSESFDEIWGMGMSASKASQPRVDKNRYRAREWLNSYSIRYLKFLTKHVIKSASIPLEYHEVLLEMESQGIGFDDREIELAVNVVKRMKPYKNWK